MSLTWLEVKNKVDALLLQDASRLGAETFKDSIVLQAAIDLQSHVIPFQKNHETVYVPADFVTDGEASRGTLPEGAFPEQAWLVKSRTAPVDGNDDDCWQYPVEQLPWANRMDMVSGKTCFKSRGYLAIDDQGRSFYVVPEIQLLDADNFTYRLRLFWNGIKTDWADTDVTQFNEQSILAFALYCKYHAAVFIEKNPMLAKMLMDDYVKQRRACILDLKNTRLLRE